MFDRYTPSTRTVTVSFPEGVYETVVPVDVSLLTAMCRPALKLGIEVDTTTVSLSYSPVERLEFGVVAKPTLVCVTVTRHLTRLVVMP